VKPWLPTKTKNKHIIAPSKKGKTEKFFLEHLMYTVIWPVKIVENLSYFSP
jgi:hypothetical protein